MAARRAQVIDAAQEVQAVLAALNPDEHEGPELMGQDLGVGSLMGGRGAVARERELAILLTERDSAARSHDIEVRVPRHLSASAMVSFAGDPKAFARDLRRPMPSPPALAARRGTAFHAWVEQHFLRATFVDLLDLPGSADDDPADDEELPRMKQRFLASEWAGRRPEAIEIAIETTVAGMSVRGRIDAVFLRPGGGFTVVDWKTGGKPSGARAKARALQLASYRLAFARLRGLTLDQVDAAFYYAGTGETVFPELPEQEQLETLLESIPA
jgi:DNA helicase-2/ATP-dependent DNA helicase PcrA